MNTFYYILVNFIKLFFTVTFFCIKYFFTFLIIFIGILISLTSSKKNRSTRHRSHNDYARTRSKLSTSKFNPKTMRIKPTNWPQRKRRNAKAADRFSKYGKD